MLDKRIKSFLEDRLKMLESIRNEREFTTAELGDIACCKQTLAFIDSLQEEPVSEELESWDKFSHIDDAIEDYCRYDSHIVFFTESLNGEPLEEADDREQIESAFKAGAKWQKSNLWKPADGDDLPEIDREVIGLLNNGKVVFAHRPYKGKYIGKNLTTGNIETFENKTYDKGGWNIPDVKYWLDVELPKEIEL